MLNHEEDLLPPGLALCDVSGHWSSLPRSICSEGLHKNGRFQHCILTYQLEFFQRETFSSYNDDLEVQFLQESQIEFLIPFLFCFPVSRMSCFPYYIIARWPMNSFYYYYELMGFNNFNGFQSMALIILICAQIVPSLASSVYFLNSSDSISAVFDSFLAFRNKMFLTYPILDVELNIL